MAADLHIHVFEGIDEEVLRAFFSNILGSKWFNPNSGLPRGARQWEAAVRCIEKTPQIWIGEVSWLKAALYGLESFVPEPVRQIHELIGEDLPTLDDVLEKNILAAFAAENATGYRLARVDDVRAFLAEHKFKKLFVVSW